MTSGSDDAITVRRLSKRFELQQERRYSFKERVVRGRPKGVRDFWALRDVSFDVPRGSFFGIVGHNGSGKSTALKVLAGIYRPTSGEVQVRGRLRAMLELGAGFHPELTGRENIQLNASILGLSQRDIRSSMDEIIEFSGIGEFIDSPVKVYSSGMSVRLGFSVAVMLDPEILIVDEVIAVGDEEFQRKSLDHLLKLRRQGTTIVLVTHSMSVVEEMCDEAIWIDHGEVRGSGNARQVVADYMDLVNKAEVANLNTSPAAGSLDAARRGVGGARVERLRYALSPEQPSDVLLSGEPGYVTMNIHASAPIPDCQVSFVLHAETGEPLASPSPWRADLTAGETVVQFQMSDVTVQPGSYLVSTEITAGGELIDQLDRAFSLKVRDVGGSGIPGHVRLPGTWDREPTTNR